MSTQRGNRGAMVRVALVGYTNVGKSTLMNAVGKSEVFVENKLFATLDTTVRKTVIKNLPFLLSDTVGFIRKLPTQLVDSFKSTLDEVREADLLLHVVDISHPEFEDHISAVNKILLDIKSVDKPTIMVFNKIDAYKYVKIDESDETIEKTSKNFSLQDWEKTWMSNLGENNTLFISATEKENFETFREKVYEAVRSIHISRFPYNKFLYPDYKDVIEEEEN
jgi:GTP-binding protein HflX